MVVMVVMVANSVLMCRLFNAARSGKSGAGCATLHRDLRWLHCAVLEECCRLYNTAALCTAVVRASL